MPTGNFDVFEAVRNANVPTLLMFLVQATGDRRWLESPYLPARTEGLGVNDSGGLAPEIQEEIRVAAAKEISAWLSGSQLAIEDPDEDLMVEMLSAAVGEAVPSEYGPLLRCERDRFSRQAHVPDAGHPAPEGFRILVIGAGMSGLIAAAYLEDAGIDYFVVDKQPEPGGSWW